MSEASHDAGLVMVILQRLEKQRLPLALELKDKVDRGERLEDLELTHLTEMLNDAKQVKPLIEQHPEYQQLAAQVLSLYSEITQKALENERRV
jgi:hypothetical protein